MEKKQTDKKTTYQTPEMKRIGNLKDITAGKTGDKMDDKKE